jgi:hypothetical protein
MPAPATALPRINMVEEVATPHSRDPISNKAKKLRKVNWHVKLAHFQT